MKHKYLSDEQVVLLWRCKNQQLGLPNASSLVFEALEQLYMLEGFLELNLQEVQMELWQLGWIDPSSTLGLCCLNNFELIRQEQLYQQERSKLLGLNPPPLPRV